MFRARIHRAPATLLRAEDVALLKGAGQRSRPAAGRCPLSARVLFLWLPLAVGY